MGGVGDQGAVLFDPLGIEAGAEIGQQLLHPFTRRRQPRDHMRHHRRHGHGAGEFGEQPSCEPFERSQGCVDPDQRLGRIGQQFGQPKGHHRPRRMAQDRARLPALMRDQRGQIVGHAVDAHAVAINAAGKPLPRQVQHDQPIARQQGHQLAPCMRRGPGPVQQQHIRPRAHDLHMPVIWRQAHPRRKGPIRPVVRHPPHCRAPACSSARPSAPAKARSSARGRLTRSAPIARDSSISCGCGKSPALINSAGTPAA